MAAPGADPYHQVAPAAPPPTAGGYAQSGYPFVPGGYAQGAQYPGPPPAHGYSHPLPGAYPGGGYAPPPQPHPGYAPPPAQGYPYHGHHPPPAPSHALVPHGYPGGYPGHPPPAYGGYPPHPGYPLPPHPGHYGWPPPHQPYGWPPVPGPPRSRSPRRGGRRGLPEASKYTCRYFIGIENENVGGGNNKEEFRVVRRIIGAGGSKMKDIVARSGGDAKLRLRGKGSGFVERDTKEESREPLQLCVSCPRADSYNIAMRCTEELLRDIYGQYNAWCAERGRPDRAPEIRMTERHHTGDAEQSSVGNKALADEPPAGKKRGARGKRRNGSGANADGAKVEDPSDDSDDDDRAGPDADRGARPPGAPDVEAIEREIELRNEARKRSDFLEADRIRDHLKEKGVVLSDERGGHGSGCTVTSWRYWTD